MNNRGAALTAAEGFLYRVRRSLDSAKEHYQQIEDQWTEQNVDRWERPSQYRLALAAARREDTDMGRAYRVWQRLRRWGAIANLVYQKRKRDYFDENRFQGG